MVTAEAITEHFRERVMLRLLVLERGYGRTRAVERAVQTKEGLYALSQHLSPNGSNLHESCAKKSQIAENQVRAERHG
jgi:hypothetical protein